MFKLIDNYMCINRRLAEAIGSILEKQPLLEIGARIEKEWSTYIGPYC